MRNHQTNPNGWTFYKKAMPYILQKYQCHEVQRKSPKLPKIKRPKRNHKQM